MRTISFVTGGLWALAIVLLVSSGCSGTNDTGGPGDAAGGDTGSRGGEQTGQACKVATDCYPGLEAGALKGEVQCLDRVANGYCTHLCQTDADCCAVSGECKTGFKQVCGPFESTGQMMCFLSCEA